MKTMNSASDGCPKQRFSARNIVNQIEFELLDKQCMNCDNYTIDSPKLFTKMKLHLWSTLGYNLNLL